MSGGVAAFHMINGRELRADDDAAPSNAWPVELAPPLALELIVPAP